MTKSNLQIIRIIIQHKLPKQHVISIMNALPHDAEIINFTFYPRNSTFYMVVSSKTFGIAKGDYSVPEYNIIFDKNNNCSLVKI